MTTQAIAAKYAHEEAGESERPLKVCAEAGRKCVRNIQQHTILSAEWIALVDSLKQLARLVQLESRMPPNTKASEVCGRDPDTHGTLWDQEAHENAIRILVEEAKVNLCLRMMSDYKRWQYNSSERARTMQEAMGAFNMSETSLDNKCRMFEESLGILLMKAFQHKETLQLMDIPLLIEHCCVVFSRASQVPTPVDIATAKTQEILVPYYFSSLMKHSEDLNNEELLARARETNLIFLAAQHLCSEMYTTLPEVLLVGAEGFAALADNEDFRTNWPTFFMNEANTIDVAKRESFVVQLNSLVVEPVLKIHPDKRRDLRPLLDLFRLLERQ
jgi:hypothetical protein